MSKYNLYDKVQNKLLSSNFFLYQSAKPRIVQKPADQVVKEGSFTKFQCVAAGQPRPTVFWTKQGRETPFFPNQANDRHFVSLAGELDISNVKKEDEGVYTCQALSPVGLGSSSAAARLTVIGKRYHIESHS